MSYPQRYENCGEKGGLETRRSLQIPQTNVGFECAELRAVRRCPHEARSAGVRGPSIPPAVVVYSFG